MLSSQVLTKGDTDAILDPGLLTISRDRLITRIPLAAVQEVHPRGDKALEIVLTDRAVHRIEGGNAYATTAFLTALNNALPEERDPAGSALVTTEEGGFILKMWQAWTGGAAALAAYVGYVWWTAAAHGGGMGLAAFAGLLALLVGLLSTFAVVMSVIDKAVLARRGITVVARRAYYPNGKKARHYTFTDTSGNEHSQDAPHRVTENIHVVYDPEKPARHAARETVFMIVLKHTSGGALALGILSLGLWGVLAPYI
ncbi:hypothetical protein [Streptomyces sp. NBC_00572]|uniref:hypothetical protein n=1 Tax=Streptomyces sp. NBC_00572 TaxID=2903664 RepID=UPI00225301CA|nr:hypothetical protein [Streptomyces sp. NBC_00572]MCX4982640.1 hypothetical protein [Streptomyces sp. NBC_00572]